MGLYIKRNSDGKVIFHCNSQIVANDLSLAEDFLTSRDLVVAEHTIADGTEAEVEALIAAAVTPMELWEGDMGKPFTSNHKGLSRFEENHIRDLHGEVAGNPFDQAEYDAKVERRSQRP